MKTNYTIKNFRVFGEEGAYIDFAPLTILTGCNSSGKSSIVKSVLLLDSFMKNIKEEHELDRPINLKASKLDFTTYPNNLLGRYREILNRNAQGQNITFSYSTYSNMLGAEVVVELTFCPDKNDTLDKGHISKITVKQNQSIIYSSDKEEGSWANFLLMRDAFFEFITIQSIARNYLGLEAVYEFEGNVSKNEYDDQIAKMKSFFKTRDRNRLNDVFRYMRFIKDDEILSIEEIQDNQMSDTIEHDWLMYIPVVDYLSGLSKTDAIKKLKEIILKEGEVNKREMLSRIVKEFEESDTNDFGDFYYEMEKAWMSHLHLRIFGDIFSKLNSPSIPNANCVSIDQTHIMHNPVNCLTIDLFDDNNDKCIEQPSTMEDRIKEWLNVESSFDLYYSIIMRLNELYGAPKVTKFYTLHDKNSEILDGYTHNILRYVGKFIANALEEILIPNWSGSMKYVSSSRVDIRRFYDLQADNDFTRLLKSYFETKRNQLNYLENYNNLDKRDYVPDSFMNKWVDKFKIGKAIKLELDPDGVGVKIRLEKYDGTESLLANEGYGITQLMSILLQIECAILSAKSVKINRGWKQWKLDGYQEDKFHYAEQTIAIEEPEIHLHPAYQSLLADMLVEAVQDYNIHFIVETHSEYLIRKLQVLIGNNQKNQKSLSTDKVAIYYVDMHNGTSSPRRIEICEDGYLDSQFGTGFYDQASKLAKELL